MKNHGTRTLIQVTPTTGDSAPRNPIGRIALLVTTALCALSLAIPVSAEIRIHSPQEVLDDWSFTSGGRLFFQDADGDLHEFVTEISDPAITNKGEGAFFVPEVALVEEALDAITYPLDSCDIDVFMLPYPRRGTLVSSAGHQSIYLSPGVVSYEDYQVHALIAHEIGHLIHNQEMPDSDRTSWNRYRRLRHIDDTGIYNESAAHKDRPHEIFAEDFRFLFGGDLAAYSGSIENRSLILPDHIPGLESFLLGLVGEGATANGLPAPGRLHMFPNPTQGGVTISLAHELTVTGPEPMELRVFDVRGRLVDREILPAASGLRWEGRLPSGQAAPPGLYFVRVQRGERSWVGKVLVSR